MMPLILGGITYEIFWSDMKSLVFQNVTQLEQSFYYRTGRLKSEPKGVDETHHVISHQHKRP